MFSTFGYIHNPQLSLHYLVIELCKSLLYIESEGNYIPVLKVLRKQDQTLIEYSYSIGLLIITECGRLEVSPGEIVVLPQGFRFVVYLPDGPSRGYVAEIFGSHFQLPDLGPIGI